MIPQRMENNLEVLAQEAAENPSKVGPYMQFLITANQATRYATDEQRRLMRALAATLPTPEQATTGIEKIMGWEETGAPGWRD